MLERIDELTRRGESFSFETTLASRTFAPLLRRLAEQDYHVVLLHFWLRAPELAVIRVAERVLLGGHHVPEEIVRRRSQRGLHNFFNLYRPLAHEWRVYDNSDDRPRLVAHEIAGREVHIVRPYVWEAMLRAVGGA